MITGMIVAGLVAFIGAIFAVRRLIMRLEDQQPIVESDSSFAMWSQDVPGERNARRYGVRSSLETVAYGDNTSTWDDARDDGTSSRTGIGLAAVESDWERDDPRNAPEPGFSDASDMGALDSDPRMETDSSSSDTGDSSDSSLDDSDFSDSSDMGGLDN